MAIDRNSEQADGRRRPGSGWTAILTATVAVAAAQMLGPTQGPIPYVAQAAGLSRLSAAPNRSISTLVRPLLVQGPTGSLHTARYLQTATLTMRGPGVSLSCEAASRRRHGEQGAYALAAARLGMICAAIRP
jgi:hypothetical protein